MDTPIVVGYAFGPKKMSTMGVVMAEASSGEPSLEPSVSFEAEYIFDTIPEDMISRNHKNKESSVASATFTTCSTTLAPPSSSVTFVPLNLDKPLDDQHPKPDIVLHKLTEDILYCSKHAEMSESRRRLDHLQAYCQGYHIEMVDPPNCVKALMSRAELNAKLLQCLPLYTTSNIAVTIPKFAVLHGPDDVSKLNDLQFPVIAKPLIAAGTKASHRMTVVLQPNSCPGTTFPNICQEYANHNGTLYKVYVLGKQHVFVYQRPSLPNLPSQPTRQMAVHFDSQRPYPTLSDFGYDDTDCGAHVQSDDPPPEVTAQEVQPIVDALQETFGLELFGFDLIFNETTGFLIVDVNYFPSYKEVSYFPSLLSTYLRERVRGKR